MKKDNADGLSVNRIKADYIRSDGLIKEGISRERRGKEGLK
jgi:hypothetical protein